MDIIGIFIYMFLSVNLNKVGCTIIEPGVAGELNAFIKPGIIGEASFKWNSSINYIVEASWGLCQNGSKAISDNFVLVKLLGGLKVLYNDGYLDGSPYKDRIQYVGDIEKGQAWFVIKNLTFQDAGAYCAELIDGPKEKPEPKTSYKVILKVSLEPTTTSPPIITTTPTPSSTVIPTTNKTKDCSPDCKEGYSGGMTNAQKWGIGGGVTGTCVLIVVAGAAGRHYYKKNHNN